MALGEGHYAAGFPTTDSSRRVLAKSLSAAQKRFDARRSASTCIYVLTWPKKRLSLYFVCVFIANKSHVKTIRNPLYETRLKLVQLFLINNLNLLKHFNEPYFKDLRLCNFDEYLLSQKTLSRRNCVII